MGMGFMAIIGYDVHTNYINDNSKNAISTLPKNCWQYFNKNPTECFCDSDINSLNIEWNQKFLIKITEWQWSSIFIILFMLPFMIGWWILLKLK